MLRPIDMTLTIQHAADAHRAGANDSNAARPEVAQQMFTDSLEKQLRAQEKQVIQSHEPEKGDVNPDRKGDGSGYNAKRKPRQARQVKKTDTQKTTGESMFDIMV